MDNTLCDSHHYKAQKILIHITANHSMTKFTQIQMITITLTTLPASVVLKILWRGIPNNRTRHWYFDN